MKCIFLPAIFLSSKKWKRNDGWREENGRGQDGQISKVNLDSQISDFK